MEKTNVKFTGSIGSNPVNVESKVHTEIDWEERKWELLKVVAQGFLASGDYNSYSSEFMAQLFVSCTNEILDAYRKLSKK